MFWVVNKLCILITKSHKHIKTYNSVINVELVLSLKKKVVSRVRLFI